MTTRKTTPPTLPTREALLDFIRSCDPPPGKREIARAFHLRGSDKVHLKAMLKELAQDGLIEGSGKRDVRPAGQLPPVTLLDITGLDADGELLAKPSNWPDDTPAPVIYMAPERKGRRALKTGDHVLARLRRINDESYEGRTIKVLGAQVRQVLGVYERGERGGRLRPTDRRNKTELSIKAADSKGAAPGELVVARPKSGPARMGLREAVVVERLGSAETLKALSLIAIHEHDLPNIFSQEALDAAEAAGPAPLGDRADLRDLPLVTIDGADARDFDDAVWAETDDDPENPGGWHLLVAIADVAHYVHAGSALDRDARERGNSVYFPDRVVPMLPEALSNGWCSLRPDEERPCLVAHLWLDKDGRLQRHHFERALMRSVARLTYETVQDLHDGSVEDADLQALIKPLYGAFEALSRARAARGTLDFDLPESQVRFTEDGEIETIAPRQRLDSHRLIEEFMITANVAAAETLEAVKQPCMYRVHDAPDPQKLEALRQSLETFGLRLARGQVLRPADFNRLLQKVRGSEQEPLVNELVLRCQSQAAYSPDNLGHFGLSLRRYAHFTSPIRRYSDLLVHRALIVGLKLGKDGLNQAERAGFGETAEHISATERRAQLAERDTMDRFTAAFLRRHLGAILQGRIRGVTRFGLFVETAESSADGLVPVSSLPDDWYDHVEQDHSLVGRRWGRVYRLGEAVSVRLREADPLTGGIVFELIDGDDDGSSEKEKGEPDSAGWDPLGSRAPGRRAGQRKPAGRKRRRHR